MVKRHYWASRIILECNFFITWNLVVNAIMLTVSLITIIALMLVACKKGNHRASLVNHEHKSCIALIPVALVTRTNIIVNKERNLKLAV